MTRAAVITGDIVQSSALSAATLDDVMDELERAALAMADWPGMSPPVFERFRGDGWQVRLDTPRFALRAVLCFRAALRGGFNDVATRLGVSVGSATLAPRLAASSGAAFEASGRALEALGTHARWGFGGTLADHARDELAHGLFAVCDELSRGWTQRQAQVFAQLAVPKAPTMAALAESLSVTAQTVQSHFDRAGGHALLKALDGFEAAADQVFVLNTA